MSGVISNTDHVATVFNERQSAAIPFTCLASGHHSSASEQYYPFFAPGMKCFFRDVLMCWLITLFKVFGVPLVFAHRRRSKSKVNLPAVFYVLF
jgi:hypothetical protein